MMEGPFGLVSSRCLPRWPWSVFVVSYMSGASHCGGRSYRPHSPGAIEFSSSSSTNPGTPSCFEKNSSAEGVRRGKGFHHHQTHRHVVNAVDKANEVGGQERSRRCFPTLRQFCEALVGSKDARRRRESLNRMSYRERLNYHSKWTEGPRSFEVFVLNAPDCPDEVKASVSKDARQRSHEAQAVESQGKRHVGGGLRNLSPRKNFKQRSRSRSPQSSHSKLENPPGRSALRSLTPEGVRSRSRSPPAKAFWAEETSFNGNWSRPSPPKVRPRSPKGVPRSRSGSPPRERITPLPWCRPESPKRPKDAPRPRHQFSSRPHRFQSPIRNSSTKSPAGNAEEERLRIYRPCSSSGVKCRSAISSRNVNMGMSRPLCKDQSRPRRRPSPSKAPERPRSPPPRAQNGPGSEATTSLGGALAVQLGDPPNHLVAMSPPSNPATAHIRLTDSLGTFLAQNPSEAVDAVNLKCPPGGTTSDRPRPVGSATTQTKLMDSTENDDTKTTRVSKETRNSQPFLYVTQIIRVTKESRSRQPSPDATRLRLLDRSENIDVQSPSKPEEVKRSQESGVGVPVPDTVYEGREKEEDYNRRAERGEAGPEAPPLAGGTKQRLDTMAIDVLRQLKQHAQPRGPVKRRTYEVAIPAGVWKLNFIPNGNPSTGSGTTVSSKTSSSSSSRGKSRGCF